MSPQAIAHRLAVRLFFRPVLGPRVPIGWQRRMCELVKYTLVRPTGVRRETLMVEGRRVERLAPKSRSASGADDAVIVYWHGGGYAIGSPAMMRSVTMRLAKLTGLQVYAPAYRLAPEHPYPAQLDDGMAFVAALARQGIAVSRMVFAGDSAGANLALSVALRCRDTGQDAPRGLLLISPWVDVLAERSDSQHGDALLSAAWSRQLVDAFLPHGVRERYRSLVDCELQGLPPTLIQYASAEMLAPDARLLARKMREAGVDVRLEEAAGMWHDYHLHAGLVPEATGALARAAGFIAALGVEHAVATSGAR